MILDLDLGNTRLKWRETVRGQTPLPSSAVELSKHGRLQDLDLRQRPERIRVSTVRGRDTEASIVEWAKRNYGIEPEFARSSSWAAGVKNGYSLPEALGIDRWLGLLAAYNLAASAAVVFDFGSAITADAVTKTGCHLGGCISPGLTMMRNSLLAGTDLVRFAGDGDGRLGTAQETRLAVENGILAAAVGFADQLWQRLGPETGAHKAIITGGDAPKIAAHLPFPYSLEVDLVLDGLALALP